MDSIEQKRFEDLSGEPDSVQYKVLFFVVENGESELYETLNLSSPPVLPDKGEYIDFEFIVDEHKNESEVFREDGYIPSEEIGTDERYSRFTSFEFQVVDISTTYHKGVSDDTKKRTVIKKKVELQPSH